jgi:hypothetical protein
LARTGVFCSGSKEDHIPPALAVPGYRVTHSAPVTGVALRGIRVQNTNADARIVRVDVITFRPRH